MQGDDQLYGKYDDKHLKNMWTGSKCFPSRGAELGTSNTGPSPFYSNPEMTSYAKGRSLARGEESLNVFPQK